MENLESVMRRIKKLLAIAEDSRGDPNECAAAARMAESIMRNFQIEHADVITVELQHECALSIFDIGATMDMQRRAKEASGWAGILAVPVAELFDAQARYAYTPEKGKTIRFLGYKTDVQMCRFRRFSAVCSDRWRRWWTGAPSGTRWGSPPMACTMGSRRGEPARSQVVRRASIALSAACRCVPSAAGSRWGGCRRVRPAAFGRGDQDTGCLSRVECEHSRFPFRHSSPPPSQIGERGRYEVVVRCHKAHCNRGPGDRERPVWREWTSGLAEVIVKRLTEGSIQVSQPANCRRSP